jgi:hypothetical protein
MHLKVGRALRARRWRFWRALHFEHLRALVARTKCSPYHRGRMGNSPVSSVWSHAPVPARSRQEEPIEGSVACRDIDTGHGKEEVGSWPTDMVYLWCTYLVPILYVWCTYRVLVVYLWCTKPGDSVEIWTGCLGASLLIYESFWHDSAFLAGRTSRRKVGLRNLRFRATWLGGSRRLPSPADRRSAPRGGGDEARRGQTRG